ncbi:MAG: transcriptional repressor LexA [Gammaproteobacteria bacterium]|nr:transcriptional repressor LexA [Gammaproteobacteria bacterium]
MKDKLTQRQTEVLQAIRAAVKRTGLPPTRSELAETLGFRSPNAAEDHLRALARKGAITLLPGASRGIRLSREAEELGLPVIGRVAAGQPLLATEHLEERYQIDPALFRPAADYLLRVRGTSMQGAGILDGDLLAVHATPDAVNGQIVVVRLDDEVTVKRFYRRGHHVSLAAENPDFANLEIDLRTQNLIIEGLGVGVIRMHAG